MEAASLATGMHFATDPKLDGHTNMARDSALLDAAENGASGARVYQWDGPWISLGHWQNPSRDLLPSNTTPWVMRPTGGKAVLHGHDVTIGIGWPLHRLTVNDEELTRLTRSVKTVYRRIIAPIVLALNQCGVPAILAEQTRYVSGGGHTSDCFAHISANDVVHAQSGLKVCGCALRLTAKAVLVQASVPNGAPLVDPSTVYENPATYSATTWDAAGFPAALHDALRNL